MYGYQGASKTKEHLCEEEIASVGSEAKEENNDARCMEKS